MWMEKKRAYKHVLIDAHAHMGFEGMNATAACANVQSNKQTIHRKLCAINNNKGTTCHFINLI